MSLPFPLSKLFHIPYIQHIYISYICIHIDTYIHINIICSIHMLLKCMLSGLTIWQLIAYFVLFPEEDHIFPSSFSHLPIVLCVVLKSHGLFSVHFGISIVAVLFSSCLGSDVGVTLWQTSSERKWGQDSRIDIQSFTFLCFDQYIDKKMLIDT